MYAHARIRTDLVSPDLIMSITETYLIIQSFNKLRIASFEFHFYALPRAQFFRPHVAILLAISRMLFFTID